MRRTIAACGALAVLAFGLADTLAIAAEAGMAETFEDPVPSWRPVGGDAPYRITQHDRVRQSPHGGQRCERVTLVAGVGSRVHIEHAISPSAVISELHPSVWIRSDRTGVQLLARVVLPRSIDPKTGRPVTALLRGSAYSQVGRWQQLHLEDIPRQLDRQVAVLRARLGPEIDAPHAYVDALVLNVYGGRGTTNVWIDDLLVQGHVAPSGKPTSDASDRAIDPAAPAGNTVQPAPRVRLAGAVLRANRRPVFPRIISYRGESLAALHGLGFNSVWMETTASGEQLHEARRLGLWIICPPPAANRGTFSADYDPVMAWDLGSGLTGADVDATRKLAAATRAAERDGARPLVAHAASDMHAYSRIVDVLVARRDVSAGRMTPAAYRRWIEYRPRFARPGTPFWAAVPTQLPRPVAEQAAALSGRPAAPLSCDADVAELLTHVVLSAGVRGILYTSQSRLDAGDPDSQQRGRVVRHLNLILAQLEPWIAEGNVSARTSTGDSDIDGVVIRGHRGQLLLAMRTPRQERTAAADRNEATSSADTTPVIVAPGVPETSNAYQWTPAGLRPLRQRRVTGGLQIVLDDFSHTAVILITEDPRLVAQLTKAAARSSAQAARLRHAIVDAELAHTRRVVQQTTQPGGAAAAEAGLNTVLWHLAESDRLTRSGDYVSAYRIAGRAAAALSRRQRVAWERSTGGYRPELSSPFNSAFATIGQHELFVRTLRGATVGRNQLLGGDCEDIGRMESAGWSRRRRDDPAVHGEVDVSSDGPRAGRGCLRLRVWAVDPESPPQRLELAPVWITTAPVRVTAGTIVRVRAMVRIAAPIEASEDGLSIIDSIGGPSTALDVTQPGAPWRPLVIDRVATETGDFAVTFALTGIGEASIDDVVIEPIVPAVRQAGSPPWRR